MTAAKGREIHKGSFRGSLRPQRPLKELSGRDSGVAERASEQARMASEAPEKASVPAGRAS